jgi:hypothetical protein
MQIPQIRHLTRGLTIVSGTLIAAGLGLACLRYSFAEPLVRQSYDLPYLWRAPIDTHEVALVYLDHSAKQLNQPLDDVWNRALRTFWIASPRIRRALSSDIVFDQPPAIPPPMSQHAGHARECLGRRLRNGRTSKQRPFPRR